MNSNLSQNFPHNYRQGKSPITCFRCGLCCTLYQPAASFAEATHIAKILGISLDEFIDRYVDEPPCGPDSLVITQHDGACVFLKHREDGKMTRCLIHAIRPSACREWAPDLYLKECQEGLAKYWDLKVNPSGIITGTEQKIEEFCAFLRSNICEDALTSQGHSFHTQ